MNYSCYRGKGANYDEHDHARMAEVLLEAEAIKGDKGVMKGVQKHLQKQSKAIKSIQDLRKVAQEKAKADMPGADTEKVATLTGRAKLVTGAKIPAAEPIPERVGTESKFGK